MPTPAKRLAMVPVDSSIAMMPLPGATMARAVSASCSMLIVAGLRAGGGPPSIARRPVASRGPRPPLQRTQALRGAVLAHLQQAQGVGGAVGLHGLAAGEDHAVAGAEQAGRDQQPHRGAGGLARALAAAVMVHRE